MAGLTLKGVNKVYHSGALALYDINLHLGDGEFIAVVGSEKSGKTTLLRVIAGLEEANGGKVELGGKDITDTDPRDRDIAMIFNSNTLYPSLNVYDNMAYGLRLRKASPTLIDERVKAAAEVLGLSELLAKKPKTLTSEQKQKVAFGRAIVREPKLYLFDDPLSGFDGTLKGEMANIIVNLQVRMTGTFVYATKNLTDALSMATRIMVMKEGFLQQIDTPSNLYDYPANAYVAFYIGSPTINFFHEVTVSEEDGKIYLNSKDLKMPLSEKIANRFETKDEYIGTDRKVIVGIRPEDLKETTEGDCYSIPGKISDTGAVSDIYFSNIDLDSGLPVVACVTGQKGEEINLTPDMNRIYLFDDKTRLTLLARDEGYVQTGYADADRIPFSYEKEQEIENKTSEFLKKQKVNKNKKKSATSSKK